MIAALEDSGATVSSAPSMDSGASNQTAAQTEKEQRTIVELLGAAGGLGENARRRFPGKLFYHILGPIGRKEFSCLFLPSPLGGGVGGEGFGVNKRSQEDLPCNAVSSCKVLLRPQPSACRSGRRSPRRNRRRMRQPGLAG